MMKSSVSATLLPTRADLAFDILVFVICPCKFVEVVATIEDKNFHQILPAIALGQGQYPNANSSNFGLMIHKSYVPSD